MKDKYVQLIIILQENNDFMNGGELARRLNVSDRTIRNYIKDLNDNYLVGAQIKNNHNKGYILVGEISDIKRTQHKEFEERAFFIVKYLMEHDKWVTYEEIGEALLFSSQTIRADILRIQQQINGFRKVEIESEIFKGIRLTGEEIDKRIFLDNLSLTQSVAANNLDKLLVYYYKGWFEASEITYLVKLMKNLLNELHIPLDTDNFLAIVSFLIICLKRIKDGHIVSNAHRLIEQFDITTTKEYVMSQHIMSEAQDLLKTEVEESEIVYLSFYLMSQRLLFDPSITDNTVIPKYVNESVNHVLDVLDKQYELNFKEDITLVSSLNLHLTRDLFPLTFNFQIENSYLATIKKEYIPAYNIAVTFSHLISKELNLYIPENEIGYFALHFASFIERKNKISIQAAIVEGRNKSLATLMKNKIENEIPELSIHSIVTLSELEHLSHDIQLLITPMPLIGSATIQYIQVEALMSQNDVANIRIMMDKISSNKILSVNQVIHFAKSLSIPEILQLMVSEMKLDYLYESIIERESISSTDVGNGVAIPHPLNDSEETDIRIGLGILQDPITWGNDNVDIVFLVVPGKDKQNQMSGVFEQIFKITNNQQILNKIKNIKTVDDFNHIINLWE